MDPLVVGIVALYLCGMLGIGWYASKRIQGGDDFLVAGRRLGPVMMAGTLAATEVGGGSSMGVAEKAYGEWGMSAGWYVLAMTITFVVLAVVAPRLRGALVRTVPEYFERRYGRASSLLTAVIFVVPLVGLTAVQIIASSVVLSVMLGTSYHLSVVIVCVVVTIYSVLGGLWSVTLTDIVQLVLIVGGLVIAVPFALEAAGGWDAVQATVPATKMSLTEGVGAPKIVSLVVMYLASFAVGQETVQRYFAAKDGRSATLGSLGAGGVYVLFAFVPALLGIVAFSMVQSGLLDAGPIAEHGTRYVLPVLAEAVLPAWLVGLVFAALISATMSSADSDLLAAGSIFANDIYKPLFRPGASDADLLRITRVTMVAVALLAMAVALLDSEDIVDILVFSFSIRAGGAAIPYVLGHYWKGGRTGGALAAIVLGSAMVILGQTGVLAPWGLEPVVSGLVVSLVVFVGISLIGPKLGGSGGGSSSRS